MNKHNRCDPTHHENKENEEDKGCKVDTSKHWIRLLYFWELKVSQNDTELGETTQTAKHFSGFKQQKTSVGVFVHWWTLLWMLLHAGLERAEIVDLGSKHQVG